MDWASGRSAAIRTVKAGVLEVALGEYGDPAGWPVVLSHGFPYDVHAYDEVAPILVDAGAYVLIPYLRGFGPTRFRDADTMRSGQQAALGQDLIALLDALGLERAIVAGYDWGGLASCVAAALWPERVAGLVSMAGYDIIDVAAMRSGVRPELERVMRYQHLLQTERGRDCLERYRRDLCRLLWQEWSPSWGFDELTFARTARSFDNPDFVAVVVHAYRFAFGLAAGDPKLAILEERLARRPRIHVPAVTLDGTEDPLKPGGTADHAPMFADRHEHRAVAVGHNLPWEAPGAFADAVLTLAGW
jgi:pimeloyl-ACP methyl ester carboxylesterase